MLRPWFVPPPWQREAVGSVPVLADLDPGADPREKQRAEKRLEDTQITLSAVVSDIFGKSGRDMPRR